MLYDIPDAVKTDTLFCNDQFHPIFKAMHGYKAFKCVRDELMKRKLVVYLESWDTLNKLIGSTSTLDGKELTWCRHASPKLYKNRNQKHRKKVPEKAVPTTTFS